MKIRNLTSHTINLLIPNEPCHELPADGIVAHVKTSNISLKPVEALGTLIPVTLTEYREIVDLPEPEEGVIYIVSDAVRTALCGSRPDVFAPGQQVQNYKGAVIGYVGLRQ